MWGGYVWEVGVNLGNARVGLHLWLTEALWEVVDGA